MPYKLLIPNATKAKIASFGLGRNELIRLYAALNEKLSYAAGLPQIWVVKGIARPDGKEAFCYNVVYSRGEDERPARYYCICERAGPEAIRLAVVFKWEG